MNVEWWEVKWSADPCCFEVGEHVSLCGFLNRDATTALAKDQESRGRMNRCGECVKELRRLESLERMAKDDPEGVEHGEGFDLGSLV